MESSEVCIFLKSLFLKIGIREKLFNLYHGIVALSNGDTFVKLKTNRKDAKHAKVTD